MTSRIWMTALAVLVVTAPAAMAKEDTDIVLGVAADRNSVWASMSTYELVRVNPETNAVTRRVPTTPAYLTDLAVGKGGLWGIGLCGRPNCRFGVLMRFDPKTGKRIRPLTRIGATPRAIAVGAGAVWVLGARRLLRFDPSTGRLASQGPRAIWVGRNAQDVAVGGNQVWVTTARRRGQAGPVIGPCRVVAVDGRAGRVWQRERVPCTPRSITFGFGDTWTNRTPGAPRFASDLSAGFGRVWGVGVPAPQPGEFGTRVGIARLAGFDPDGRASIGTDIATARADLLRVAVGAGAVWVANAPTGTITRIDPVTGRLAGGLELARQ